MTAFVIDASVAFKWFVPETDSGKAINLIRADTELMAPGIIWTELANAVWKNVRLGNVVPRSGATSLANFLIC